MNDGINNKKNKDKFTLFFTSCFTLFGKGLKKIYLRGTLTYAIIAMFPPKNF